MGSTEFKQVNPTIMNGPCPQAINTSAFKNNSLPSESQVPELNANFKRTEVLIIVPHAPKFHAPVPHTPIELLRIFRISIFRSRRGLVFFHAVAVSQRRTGICQKIRKAISQTNRRPVDLYKEIARLLW